MYNITSPLPQFFDKAGSSLDNGYIYIGTAGANPETTPITVYWDKAGTQPAAQPIRTVNGYIARNGKAAKVWTSANDFSITVKESNGTLVYSEPSATSTLTLEDDLAASTGAAMIGAEDGSTEVLWGNVQEYIFANGVVLESIVSLKALDKTKHSKAFLIGYYDSLPGKGGGHYWLDSADTTSADNGGTIIVATDGGRWKLKHGELVNIQCFGAKGDGSTDDRAAFVAALAAGYSIYCPDSTYKIVGSLSITTQYQNIVGESRKAILNFVPSSAVTTALSVTAFDAAIKSLQITANSNVTNIIKVNGNGSRGIVRDCLISGSGGASQIGINGDGTTAACFFWRVECCDFTSVSIGVYLDSPSTAYANAWFLDKLNFASNVPTGIYLKNTLLNTVSNIFHQTQTVAAVRLGAGCQLNTLTNIVGESNTAPTMLIDATARYNTAYGVINSGSFKICTDNGSGATDVNYISTGQIGLYSPTPTVATTAVYNRTGTRQTVVVSVGSTATNVVKNGSFLCTLTNSGVSVPLNSGESINVSQTTNVSWTWWRD